MKKLIPILLLCSVLPLKAQITITEFNYNSDSTMNTGDWFELYNMGSSAVDLSLYRLRDSSATGLYLVPPGVSIAAGGYLVFCADTQRFDAIYNITNRIGNLGFGLNNGTDGIRIYDNTNTLVKQLFYQDTLPWPMGADGYGRTLELINTSMDPADPASWRTGCILGSPGTGFSPCTGETLVISEINYKSSPTEDAGDWFEIRNIGTAYIDISGYGVRDEKNINHFIIPSGTTLAPQGSLVLYDTPALFNMQFPAVTNKVGPILFSFNGDGEAIRLYNANDKIIFSVFYDDDTPWSNQPDGGGYTLEADTNFNFSHDVNNGNSWFAGCPEGSPGKKYNPDCLGGVNENENIDVVVYPNPTTDVLYLKTPLEMQEWMVSIYDASGRKCLSLQNTYTIPVTQLADGIYILEIQTKEWTGRITFNKTNP